MISLALASLLLSSPPPARPADRIDDRPFWTGHPTATAFARNIDRRLGYTRTVLGRLLAVRGRRTIANTLVPYDRIRAELNATGGEAQLIAAVHPDSGMRTIAEQAGQRVSSLATDLSLDRRVFDAIAAVDLRGADPATRYYVDRIRLEFRLAGVDRDNATRARIRALRDELLKAGQEFSRNIRDDVRPITVDSPADLEGLPEDFLASHRPDSSGHIALTTAYPDVLPVLTYAKSDDLRRRARVAFDTRAYPQNLAVLDRVIALRAELAQLLGYSSWADYITADKMVGSAANASAFIDRIVEASDSAAAREYRVILRRKRMDQPGATVVNRWESTYFAEQVRRADYDFNSQRVRPYFPYQAVKRGVLEVASRLFGVTFRPMRDAPVWHPSVEGWEMLERGKLVGRFYLDMHPRPGKFEHAAHFGIRNGIEGMRLPESALVANLPGGTPGDPGLMSHEDVVSLFHEFGHLMHELLGGRQRWSGLSGVRTEWDFVEAPSQMLEEWTWDPAVLAGFARHHETGEPIPAGLVGQMKRASRFGRALNVRQQMVYARVSLAVYDRPPEQVNTDSIARAVTEAYTPFPPVPDAHFQTSFGHLDGYSAVYYTYMWSQVIAKDFFSTFDRSNLFTPGPAQRYRDAILAPGGSAPAATLVERLLGRPFEFDAWRRWLEEGT